MSPTIGVVIPCYKPHIPQLGRVLWSINNQSRLPDMVVVSCSSSQDSDIMYRAEDYKFSLKIFTHIEKRNTAQNKNFGIQQINTDIISFFDSDDIMHPQRIDIIYNCFVKYPNTKIFLHSLRLFPTDLNFPKYDINTIEYIQDPFYVCKWNSLKYKYDSTIGITNGNCSVYKSIFNEIQFNETDKGCGKEDQLFNVVVVNKYWNDTVFCTNELTWYIPSYTGGYK
jgi:glycosyltransferase involved in cell wall biosynthesis